jgi:hypothetical protein
MVNKDSTVPKYRIDFYTIDDGVTWEVEVYADGEDVVSLRRLFLPSAADDALDHVIDLYEEEYEDLEDDDDED